MKTIKTISNSDLEAMIASGYLYLVRNNAQGCWQLGKRELNKPDASYDPCFEFCEVVEYPQDVRNYTQHKHT